MLPGDIFTDNTNFNKTTYLQKDSLVYKQDRITE